MDANAHLYSVFKTSGCAVRLVIRARYSGMRMYSRICDNVIRLLCYEVRVQL